MMTGLLQIHIESMDNKYYESETKGQTGPEMSSFVCLLIHSSTLPYSSGNMF